MDKKESNKNIKEFINLGRCMMSIPFEEKVYIITDTEDNISFIADIFIRETEFLDFIKSNCHDKNINFNLLNIKQNIVDLGFSVRIYENKYGRDFDYCFMNCDDWILECLENVDNLDILSNCIGFQKVFKFGEEYIIFIFDKLN